MNKDVSSGSERSPSYSPVEKRTMEQVLAVMKELHFPIADSREPAMYRAICLDALRRKDVMMLVAERDGEVLGVCIAVSRWVSYWRGFLLRWPRCAALIAMQRIREWMGALGSSRRGSVIERVPAIDAMLEKRDPDVDWRHSRRDTANIVFLSVLPKYRGTPVAFRLFAATLKELQRRGISRVLARARRDNTLSIRLGVALGFHIYCDGNDILALYAADNPKKVRRSTTRVGSE